LSHLQGIVPNLYLFGEQKEQVPGWVTHVVNWENTVVCVSDQMAV